MKGRFPKGDETRFGTKGLRVVLATTTALVAVFVVAGVAARDRLGRPAAPWAMPRSSDRSPAAPPAEGPFADRDNRQLRMFTARAATRRIVTADRVDSAAISRLAGRVSGIASVGLNAIELVSDT